MRRITRKILRQREFSKFSKLNSGSTFFNIVFGGLQLVAYLFLLFFIVIPWFHISTLGLWTALAISVSFIAIITSFFMNRYKHWFYLKDLDKDDNRIYKREEKV